MDSLERIYTEIKAMIDSETKTQGENYTIGKFSGWGWLFFNDISNTTHKDYPTISLKQYDKTVNIYLLLPTHGELLYNSYTNIFGKSALGKGCIRIKKFTPQRKDALKQLIQLSINYYNKSLEGM